MANNKEIIGKKTDGLITIPCKLCDDNIEWKREDTMFAIPKPFPICDDCLGALKDIIKERKKE